MAVMLVFDKVRKDFKLRKPPYSHVAIDDFNLTVREGEFFCLLGPSGCGKTTVLNMVAGFERPTGGKITLHGQLIERPGADRGVIFQGDDCLFPWLTAAENVMFGLVLRGMHREPREEIAETYLNLVGLHGQGRKFPKELSGGMRQRVQIARILANEPSILLMDEPFAALDAQTRKNMQEEMARIWRESKKTVLFVTHDIVEAIVLGDRVGFMRAAPSSKVREVVPVDLPRPRDRTGSDFGEYYKHLNRLMEEEVKRGTGSTWLPSVR